MKRGVGQGIELKSSQYCEYGTQTSVNRPTAA